MARRDGFVLRVDQPCDGGQPPNQQIAQVTVEIRCHWPRRATQSDVFNALSQAVDRAADEFDRVASEPSPENTWVVPPPGWTPPGRTP